MKLTKHELIKLVEQLMDPTDLPEERIDELAQTIQQHVPDPAVLDYIFWPDREMTAEEVIDRALAFEKPTAAQDELVRMLDELMVLSRPDAMRGYAAQQEYNRRFPELYRVLRSHFGDDIDLLPKFAFEKKLSAAEVLHRLWSGQLQGDPLWMWLQTSHS